MSTEWVYFLSSCDSSPHIQLVYSLSMPKPLLSCACLCNNNKWCLPYLLVPPLTQCCFFGASCLRISLVSSPCHLLVRNGLVNKVKFLGAIPKGDKDQWDCNNISVPHNSKFSKISTQVSVPFWAGLCVMLLGYTVAKVCASPRKFNLVHQTISPHERVRRDWTHVLWHK